MPATSALRIQKLKFRYQPSRPLVLDIPNLEVRLGEKVFIHGPSGSGKSTLLGLITGVLAAPDAHIEVLGKNFSTLNDSARDTLRGAQIGYIFQMLNLIPYLSVRENILLPCRIHAERRKALASQSLTQAAAEIAEHLGIGTLLKARVTELSVGQQQRVAVARALIGRPALIVADEPTSALDADHRERFLKLLFAECALAGSTLLFVSHDQALAKNFDRSLSLREINLVRDEARGPES